MSKTPVTIHGSTLGDLIAMGFTDIYGNTVSDTNNIIYGYLGDDIIHAAGGADRVWGGDGHDWIHGGLGRDRLDGEDGNDTLFGGEGNDLLRGGLGDDELFGEAGNDALRGGSGNDLLDGDIGDDTLIGQSGENTLLGGSGRDLLDSGKGSSVLDGGADEDRLILQLSRGGDHVVTGGSEADTFIFKDAHFVRESHVTITDFELGLDRFEINGVDSALYLLLIGSSAITDSDGDALLTLTTGDSILFQGITEAQLESFFGL